VTPAVSFDARRLTLARWAVELSKKDLAQRVGVSPASITQYEGGKTVPSPATEARLALACGVSATYLRRSAGRRRPDFSTRSFFRSLRSTSQRERDRADALAEHVLDLVEIIESEVYLPPVEIPHLPPDTGSRTEIEAIAAEVRRHWSVPDGPIANVVRLLEAHGVVVARLMSHGRKLDAFSRWFADRPLIVLWADKSDKARSRFDAAHELGHLVMHTDAEPLSLEQERQANMFASAFHMPAADIAPELVRKSPALGDWPEVLRRRAHWGISAKALLYRSREMGALSEAAFRRAMQNYNRHDMRERDGGQLGAPERPLLLARAADSIGMDLEDLAVRGSLAVSFVAEVLARDSSPGAV
jgi:Zn-dependent peptidase ImmA (M78 family)/transcriptional regulator with XRE-family HTH domain